MDATARVEGELRDLFSTRQMPLYRMMAYHLGWEDEQGNAREPAPAERSHGVACLTACYAAGGDQEVGLPAAASVELVNSFCQVHDDVQGGHPKRHDRDAVWWVWGPAQAINTGDGMHALAPAGHLPPARAGSAAGGRLSGGAAPGTRPAWRCARAGSGTLRHRSEST